MNHVLVVILSGNTYAYGDENKTFIVSRLVALVCSASFKVPGTS